jgi:heme oxygenase (biliverdin-IX-beta and delta-forming)
MAASGEKASADFRMRLRQATRDAHLRLEDVVDFDGRVTSLEAYRGFLENFLRFLRPLEAALCALDFGKLGLDYASRRKLGWLEADLKDLGHSTESLARMPDFAGLPRFSDPLEALGALYILEGSSLGRQVMLGKLGSRLNIRPDWGGRFFDGYGKSTGRMWQSFVAVLNDAGRTPEAAALIEESAVAGFAAFETCLAETRRPAGGSAATGVCPMHRNG